MTTAFQPQQAERMQLVHDWQSRQDVHAAGSRSAGQAAAAAAAVATTRCRHSGAAAGESLKHIVCISDIWALKSSQPALGPVPAGVEAHVSPLQCVGYILTVLRLHR